MSPRYSGSPSVGSDYLLTRVLAHGWNLPTASSSRKGCRIRRTGHLRSRPHGRTARPIEIGNPDAARLHKSIRVRRAWPFTTRCRAAVSRLAGERIHRAESRGLVDRSRFLRPCVPVERRMAFSLSINEHELYLSIGADTLVGKVTRHPL